MVIRGVFNSYTITRETLFENEITDIIENNEYNFIDNETENNDKIEIIDNEFDFI